MFADLNYFKPINDQLGHESGDEVLVRTARMLRDAVRPSDLVARLGGDELAMWMDGADHMTAAERADALCIAVPRALEAVVGEAGLKPTISLGIATRRGGSVEAMDCCAAPTARCTRSSGPGGAVGTSRARIWRDRPGE